MTQSGPSYSCMRYGKSSLAMSYAEALLVILFTAIIAVAATNFVRRALGLDVRQQHHEVGNPVYLQIGVVFAVLLAFVFNEVFGEYNAAAQAITGHYTEPHCWRTNSRTGTDGALRKLS